MIQVLRIHNQAGSVQNYSHFIYGFVFPIIEYYQQLDIDSVDSVFVRSCGPLDRLLEELAFPKLIVLQKDRHNFLLDKTDPANIVDLEGYDNWISGFDSAVFARCREYILARLPAQDIEPHNILLVNRGTPDKFYTGPQAETRLSGNQRRSIGNFNELETALKTRFSGVLSVELENVSLAYQASLFAVPRIMIMQHGGAASNIVFAQPGAHLIEIVPQDLNPKRTSAWNKISTRLDLAVVNLAANCNVVHHSISQARSHSDLDIEQVCDLVATLGGCDAS